MGDKKYLGKKLESLTKSSFLQVETKKIKNWDYILENRSEIYKWENFLDKIPT